jgi:hypothetical protein
MTWPVYAECEYCGRDRAPKGGVINVPHVTACRRHFLERERIRHLRTIRDTAAREATLKRILTVEVGKVVPAHENGIAGSTYAVRRDIRKFLSGDHEALVRVNVHRALQKLAATGIPSTVDWYVLLCAAVSSGITIDDTPRATVMRAVQTKFRTLNAPKIAADFEGAVSAARRLWINGE